LLLNNEVKDDFPETKKNMIRTLKGRYGKFIQNSGSGFGPDPHWFGSPHKDLDPHNDKIRICLETYADPQHFLSTKKM
jgi:hypothetical protein